jgi:Xaa-Pro aminopeptidase
MLSENELRYLNDYHQRVWNALSPHLPEDVRRFLQEATEPV